MADLSSLQPIVEPDADYADVSARPVPSGRQWWLVACLTIVSMLATVDKYVISLLVGAIKAGLALSDTQMGLVVGAAFAVANAAVSLPAGWMADRTRRRSIVAAGVAFWSITAALCGAATSFSQLFLARAGVGVGEGLIPPAAYSLIRDGVAPDRRARAYSIYGMASAVGAGWSLILGGIMVGAIAASGVRSLPILGAVAPWQLALIVIGVAGMPLALLAYAFPDPGRADGARTAGATFREALWMLWKRRAVVVPLMLFSVMHAMISSSIGAWLPALLGRDFALGPQAVGPVLGGLLVVCAPVGLGASGLLMDRMAKSGPTGPAVAAVVAGCVLLTASFFMPIAPSLGRLWVLEGAVILTSTVYLPVTSTVIAGIMPTRAIGKSMSIFLLAQGVVGAGFAPVIAATISDRLFAGQTRGLAHALSSTNGLYGVVALTAAVGLYFAMKTRGRDAA